MLFEINFERFSVFKFEVYRSDFIRDSLLISLLILSDFK